jgi:hypothetical protein
VNPNSRNSRPISPGRNDGSERERRGDDRKPDFLRPVDGRYNGGFALLRATEDVLQHDDGIVHNETDREHQREQREHVDRVAERVHRRERGDDRHRNRDRRNERRAQASEERVDDDQHRHERERQRNHHLMQRGLDGDGVIHVDDEGHARRQCRLETLDGRAHTMRDVQHVGFRLGFDLDADAEPPVHPHDRALVFGGQVHVGHFAEAHEPVIRAAPDHECAEILRSIQAHVRAQGELAGLRLQSAGGQLNVLSAKSAFDVSYRELATGERLTIQPDAHGVLASAANGHARHTGHRRDLVGDVALGVIRQLQRRHVVGVEVEEHHGIGARVGLGDLRNVRLVGQCVHHARDAVANVVRRAIDVAIHREFDGDVRTLVDAARSDLLDALETGDAVLDHLGDLLLDDRG